MSESDASARGDLDPWPVAVGVLIGLAGLLFLLEPLVGPLQVGEARVRPVGLSVVSLAVGLDLGAVVFLARGRRFVGLAHAVGGAGFTALVLGVVLGSGALVLAAVVFLGGGVLFLAYEASLARKGG